MVFRGPISSYIYVDQPVERVLASAFETNMYVWIPPPAYFFIEPIFFNAC